jgi:ankyrin repeat protein
MAAARRSRPGLLQALLAKGADPNATDNQGRTALMVAAQFGRPDAVRALLNRGANKELTDNKGGSALDLAVENDQQSVLTLLRRTSRELPRE